MDVAHHNIMLEYLWYKYKWTVDKKLGLTFSLPVRVSISVALSLN